jgi:AcrR family transcriptional regulator
MATTRRERQRTATRDEIIATAWRQIGEKGAAALSLRAIAREMGVTAPALYRYYQDRAALVTTLLIDAFSSFTAALEAGRDACPPTDHAGRFRAICRAYFQWAADNARRYQLLFGTPIEGYQFAAEVGPVAQRSFLVVQGVIGEANAAGQLSGEVTLPASLHARYAALRKLGMPYTEVVTQLALASWAMLHGMTSLYLYNYLAGFVQDDVTTFIDFEVEKMICTLGLE